MEVRGYTSLSPFGPRRSTAPIAPGTPTGAASPPVAGSTHRLLDGTKAPRESSVPPLPVHDLPNRVVIYCRRPHPPVS